MSNTTKQLPRGKTLAVSAIMAALFWVPELVAIEVISPLLGPREELQVLFWFLIGMPLYVVAKIVYVVLGWKKLSRLGWQSPFLSMLCVVIISYFSLPLIAPLFGPFTIFIAIAASAGAVFSLSFSRKKKR